MDSMSYIDFHLFATGIPCQESIWSNSPQFYEQFELVSSVLQFRYYSTRDKRCVDEQYIQKLLRKFLYTIQKVFKF